MDHPSACEVQRPIGCEFLSSQRSILTITLGIPTIPAGGLVTPERERLLKYELAKMVVHLPIPFRSPTDFNPLAMPVITPSHPDPTVRELDSGGHQASSRRNMATGLERSILARSRNPMWNWTIFVNPFPDPIPLTEEVRTWWSDAWTKLRFPDFADATPPSNHQVSYPESLTDIIS